MSDARPSASIRRTAIPDAPVGWVDYHYVPLMDGTLGVIRTERDVHREWHLWRADFHRALMANEPLPVEPDFWGDQLRLSIFDGVSESCVTSVPSRRYPLVDRTFDGRWLVATRESSPGETNGRYYSVGGVELASLPLGHDIKNLFCSPDGTIWVGYASQGGYSPDEWGGLVQLDEAGRPLWSFNASIGAARGDRDEFCWDCYALTLNGTTAWTCYYHLFEIVRIESGEVTYWPNPAGGARAIAVADSITLLAGGYSQFVDRIAISRLEGSTSKSLGGFAFPPIARKGPGTVRGRNGVLHIVDQGWWYRVRPSDLVDDQGIVHALREIRQPDPNGSGWIESPIGDW